MSDKAIALLESIDSMLLTQRQPGGSLDGVRSHFTLYTAADVPPEYGIRSPVVVARMLPQTFEPSFSIPNCMVEKLYPVAFSVFTENAGDTRDPSAAHVVDAIEDTFDGQGFGISDWVVLAAKSYDQVSLPPFAEEYAGAGEIVYNYSYTDMRQQPMTSPVSMSPPILLGANDTIPSHYDVVQIFGAVTLVSTPTIAPGSYDGQLLTVRGLDDAQIPTLQDEGMLSGSTLHMQGRRGYNFGNNDSMDFRWKASQSIWVDQRRADVY